MTKLTHASEYVLTPLWEFGPKLDYISIGAYQRRERRAPHLSACACTPREFDAAALLSRCLYKRESKPAPRFYIQFSPCSTSVRVCITRGCVCTRTHAPHITAHIHTPVSPGTAKPGAEESSQNQILQNLHWLNSNIQIRKNQTQVSLGYNRIR